MSNPALRLFLAGTVAVLLAPSVRADVKLPPVISSHMVLQRDRPVPIWGTAAAGEKVTVSFAGQTKEATADGAGAWMVKLDALPASKEPRSLTVKGANTLSVEDVLVGEVWLGSGQSNMAFGMRSNRGFDELKKAADAPTLRFFTAGERPSDTEKTPPRSRWQVCTPDTVEGCSAVLYFFGRRLQDNLDGVPVGLVNASVGGTSILLWVDREVQLAQPELREGVERDEAAHAKFDVAAAMKGYYASDRYKEWQAAVEKAKAEGKAPPRQPYTPEDTYKNWLPAGTWFKTRIAPLAPFAVRGVVWYQGEADGSVDNGLRYRHQLPALIADWRRRWGQPDLPFVWVQLPYWKPAGSWFAVRESQLKTLTVPHTGMVVTIDVGDPNDVHPNEKAPVGRRLAQWALGAVYGKEVETSGPLPAGHEIDGNVVRIRFDHAKGLQAKGGELRGFEVAGTDRKWYSAEARIDGGHVLVSSKEVAAPVAVRYAWDGHPDHCTLYNAADLPATPFRTDDWPLK